MFSIKDLSQEHPYHTSDNNYYSNESSDHYDSFEDFLSEWQDVDIDYNLCIRFDIDQEGDNKDTYRGQFTIIQQRKGIYYPIAVDGIKKEDAPLIEKWLNPHFEYILKMWLPFKPNNL